MTKRKKDRHLVKKEVLVNGSTPAYALDISEGGMFIHTIEEYKKGEILDVSFDVDGEIVEARAMVRHTETGIGIGVRFQELSQENRMLIRKNLGGPEVHHKPTDKKSNIKTILIVDRNAQSRLAYKTRLLQDGFSAKDTDKGMDALKMLKEGSISLMILELQIDDIDAFRLLQLIQLEQSISAIPIIAISNRQLSEEIDRAMEFGVKDYLVKYTATPTKISETVSRVLGG